ncbi:hypothetical protein Bresa_02959|nr:hypothetical protein [Brenneria salicis ATCC 15712 = DSM 30166]
MIILSQLFVRASYRYDFMLTSLHLDEKTAKKCVVSIFIVIMYRTDLHLCTQANRVRYISICRVGNVLEQLG